MEDYLITGATALASLAFVSAIYSAFKPEVDVPAIGETGIFATRKTAFAFLSQAKEMLQEGYRKYPLKPFKVPHANGWFVFVSGKQLITELREVPETDFNSDEATDDSLHIRATVGDNIFDNLYHVPIVRNQLTRNLVYVFDDVRDEVSLAFRDFIPATTDDWLSLPALGTSLKLVSRISNRVFIGSPTCRSEDWIHLSIHFTEEVVKAGNVLSQWPAFLHRLIAHFQGIKPKAVQQAMKHLGPVIAERRAMYDQHGTDWEDKPNDFLTWLMDEAEGSERSPEAICLRVLFLNFAANHTTGMAFTHNLYNLAVYPQYIEPLREEVEEIVSREGWSRASIGKMYKLDSFMKETMRLNPPELVSLKRKALKDLKLSDGTFIPKGTHVSAASYPIHLDSSIYENAAEFDAFRFSRLRDDQDVQNSQLHLVTTSPNFLAFGDGRHACPGRFFAAQELKIMLAEVLLNYDVKIKGNFRPQNMVFGLNLAPDVMAEVMFRKRDRFD